MSELQAHDVTATRLLRGGRIHAMAGGSARHEALVVRAGRIVAVGTDREMTALADADGGQVQVTDLGGRTVIPGFIETHNHPMLFGLTLTAAVEAGTPPNETIADIVDRVEHACREADAGAWVRGYRYDDTLLADNRHPVAADLDPVSPDNPVCLTHISAHFAVVNTAGLRALGITRDSPDPEGGAIDRGSDGEPTGLLIETAAFAAYAAMPQAEHADLVEALDLAGKTYLAEGVTTVCDLGLGLTGGPGEFDAYRAAITGGRFRTRVRGYLVPELVPGLGEGQVRLPGLELDGISPDAFRIIGGKLWSDGSIQGLTGALEEGYACAPDQTGMLIYPQAQLVAMVAALHAAGLQVAVHGNGDRAIGMIIAAYRALGAEPLADDRRHRIEHCQMVHDEQLEEMARSGVLASFFIKHVYYWGDRHRDRFIGPERASRIDPLAAAISHGVEFGLHSDTPVVPVAPLEGIWCAVNRITRNGQVLGAEQAIDVETALAGYTSRAAHLIHAEETAGRLVPGADADLVVLGSDPSQVDPAALRDITVEATIIGGETVYERSAS